MDPVAIDAFDRPPRLGVMRAGAAWGKLEGAQ